MKKNRFINIIFKAILLISWSASPCVYAKAIVMYTHATELGLIEDSEDAAEQNFIILKEAIDHKKNVMLNGIFYFSFPHPLTLDYNFHLKGGEMRVVNGQAFDLVTGGGFHAFKTCIRMVDANNPIAFIGSEEKKDAMLIEGLRFENSQFFGRQLLQLYFKDIDGSKTRFGVKDIHVKDSYIEGGGRIMILDGIIWNKCEFSDNIYKDFPITPIYICYNHSAKRYNNETGSYRFVEENIRRSCAVNIVNNLFEGIKTQLDYYYCAALIESVICNFKHNTLCNIINYTDTKSLHNATCYDTYLSCSEVYYEDNTIVDMISYSKNGANKPLCEIGKSKINVLRDEGYKTIRHYVNNKYTLDASPFITEGAIPQSLGVNIFGNTDYVDDYIWKDNLLQLNGAYLCGRSSSIGYKNFVMKGNTIEVDSITGNGICMLSGNYDMEKIQIENNTIINHTDRPFYLFNQVSGNTNVAVGTISIQNNIIKGTAPKIVFNNASEVTILNNRTDDTNIKSNYYLSDYTGAKKATKIRKMKVDMPCATNGGFSDVTLSSESLGTYSYSAKCLTPTSILRGTYFLTKDGIFDINIQYVKDGINIAHTYAFEQKDNTLSLDYNVIGTGIVWKTLHEKDGITLKIRYSQADNQMFFEASSYDKSENDKNTKVTLTIISN